MKQIARNLVDPVDGFLRGASYLIHDRDPLFTKAFTAILESESVACVKIPAQSPNCNPHAERFHQGLGGQLVNGQAGSANDKGTEAPITCRSRLGGLLNYYDRAAA